jgi:hypothetical protein
VAEDEQPSDAEVTDSIDPVEPVDSFEPVEPVDSFEPAPVLARDDLLTPRRPTIDRGMMWAQLVVVVLLALLLAAAVGRVEIDRIADQGWKDNALWAVGTAVVLLGFAIAAVTTTLTSTTTTGAMARVTILAATIGVIAAVVVVGLADVNGGEIARSSVPPTVTSTSTDGGDGEAAVDEPLAPANALEPEYLATVALPIPERTTVTISLTGQGRRLMARAMGCRPGDFVGRSLVGAAIGGTWAQPLLVPQSPFDADGVSVERCQPAVVRLPMTGGTIRPGI